MDSDARLVLAISIVVLIGTAGFFFMLILVRILYSAIFVSSTGFARDSIYLVFGKQLVGDKPDREYIARLDRLIDCGCKSAILMGGRTPGNQISEAWAGLEYLKAKRYDPGMVHLEQESQSTLENLRNSRRLIQNRSAVIISNRYHLPRCSILANSLSIDHEVCAAELTFRLSAETLLKCLIEAFYIHWFYSGKYWAMLTRNQRMLQKIT